MACRPCSISYAVIDKYSVISWHGLQRARRIKCNPTVSAQRSNPMLDVVLLAAGLGFFALSIAYAFGCDRL
jgi:hypothetical protein